MIKKFNNLKLQYKLMFSHLILIAIPTIVISFFLYNNIYSVVVSDTIRQEQALSEQTSLSMNTTFEQLNKTVASLRSSAYLDALISSPNSDVSSNLVLKNSEKSNFHKAIQSQIDGELVTTIKIYIDGIDSSLYSDNNTKDILLPISKSNGSYWRGIFAGTSATSLYCPSFYLKNYETTNYGKLAYIERVGTTIANGDSSPVYVAVYFSQTKLESILRNSIPVNVSVSYILNERNSLVATSDSALSGVYSMDYNTIVDIAKNNSGFITKTVLGQEIYTGCYKITGTDWYMVSILPAAPILKKGNLIIYTFVGIYLFMLAIALLIAYMLSRSITKRVKSVCDQMSTVRMGKPIRMPDPIIHDEIGDLADTYNYMSDEMNNLLIQQQRVSEELHIAEFRALQAQINPHFLYNTMDMINWLSQFGKNKEVTAAIQALSKFYKLTLSKNNVLSTIADEAEHVTLYVKLQNMRYENKIAFLVDIPDSLLDYEIPKLTFQPIVENSIQHGILEKDPREGSIVLTGWLDKDDIIFLISDDGVGIKKDKIKTILDYDSSDKDHSNIGVYNTHRRLQMLYGSDYGLTYTSEYGRWTEVMIRIPSKKQTIHITNSL